MGFANIAQPLHALTKKEVKFKWSPECQAAFDSLKSKLIVAPILTYPNFDLDFIVETDASVKGLGAILSQRQNGNLLPIAYASRALTQSEKNYCITDLETLAIVWSLSHFRAYLYGHVVTVYTDHLAAKSVLQSPSLNGKHARWWTKVHSSGIKEVNIVYRPGRENAKADSLSRNPSLPAPPVGVAETDVQVALTSTNVDSEDQFPVTMVTKMDTVDNIESTHSSTQLSDLLCMDPVQTTPNSNTFKRAQRNDPDLSIMIRFMEEGELPADSKAAKRIMALSSHLMMMDDLLHYVDPSSGKKEAHHRVAVPKLLRQEILQNSHGGLMAGHFSGKRLYKVLSRTWWWDGMYADAFTYCKNCPACVTVTGGGNVVKPPLHPIPVQYPFQILGVDVMQLPKTKAGNKYVLVFQDFLTKWPMVFPMPDQKSSRLVKILVNEVIPQIGVPESLLSDRGTNLLSNLMQDVCKLLGITKLNTTAYHPQCDGLVERFNRTLKQMLRKHVSRYGDQWDCYLAAVIWAYRNTPHEATGEKPSFLLYGTDCRTPMEAMYLPPTELNMTDVADYRQELILSLICKRVGSS